jgi:predicted nicotinamide N-methyase
MLARAVLREPWPPGLTALEIGCGLGLPGVAALSRGLRVIFSDIDATALRFAAGNARQNGFNNFELLQLDWRNPPANLKVPVILASDLIYERRHVEPLAELIAGILAPDGTALLTDQDRPSAPYLRDALESNGLVFTTQIMRAGSPGGNRFKGTLYRMGHIRSNPPTPGP